VDTVPSWRVPHSFERDRDGQREERVVTFGLFAPLLARTDLASEEAIGDLAALVGFDEIVRLAERGVQRAPDATWPEVMSRAEAGVGPEPWKPRSPTELAANAEALDRIRLFVSEFSYLVEEIEAAADERRQPRALGGLDETSEALLGLLEVYYGRGPNGLGLGLELQPLFRRDRPDRVLWGFRFRDLAERVAVELFDLYSRRPRVRRCKLCNRVFVPSGDEQGRQFCRLRLWALPRYTIREYCVPMEQVDAHNAAVLASEHRRRRKNLWQKWRREEQRIGADSAPAKRAREAYESYMAEHRRPRGPEARLAVPPEHLIGTLAERSSARRRRAAFHTKRANATAKQKGAADG
jgi:hypothetical protein